MTDTSRPRPLSHDDGVAVIGLGLLGQLTAQMLRAHLYDAPAPLPAIDGHRMVHDAARGSELADGL